jgi:uncharacterized protein YkwD
MSQEASAQDTFTDQLVMLVNQFRTQNNLPPLKVDPALSKAAQDYTLRLSAGDFFGHNDPDFGCNKPSDRAVAAGYLNWAIIGENLAAGYATPEAAFNGFMQSPGHRAAMLKPDFREIGVGYFYDAGDASNVRISGTGSCPYGNTAGPYRHYWAQEFGARNNNGLPVMPVIINSEAATTQQREVTLYIYGGMSSTTWAQQMRFSENGANWSAYEKYASSKQYTLSAGNGPKTVYVQLSDGAATQTVSDTIYLQEPLIDPNIKPRVFVPFVRR